MASKNKTLDFTEAEERKTATFWNFRENPKIEGTLTGIEVIDGKTQLKLQLENGDNAVVGSYITLAGVLTEDDVGKAVSIEFVSETPSKIKGNKPYMNFKVLVV